MLVAAIVGGCISAGFWQLRRLDHRRTVNAQIRARSAETVPLPAGGFAGTAADALIFRRVRVTGTYEPAHEVLARFRSRDGIPGYEVVTPLRVTTGESEGVVLVDRGWIPLADGDRWPVPAMAPAEGPVEVTGLLAPAEGGSLRLERRSGGAVVTAAIDPRRLAGELAITGDLYPVAVLADEGGGGVGSGFPVPVAPPDLTEGPHFSYAVQWFLFASVGIVGWGALVVRRGPFSAEARRSVANEEA